VPAPGRRSTTPFAAPEGLNACGPSSGSRMHAGQFALGSDGIAGLHLVAPDLFQDGLLDSFVGRVPLVPEFLGIPPLLSIISATLAASGGHAYLLYSVSEGESKGAFGAWCGGKVRSEERGFLFYIRKTPRFYYVIS